MRKRLFALVIVVSLISACGGSEQATIAPDPTRVARASPTPEAPVSPTETPAPTATGVPPTDTVTPVPPAATATAPPVSPTAISAATALPGLGGTPLSLGFEPVTRNDDWTPYIEEFDGVEMALVPAGCFDLGSTDEQVDDAMRQCEQVRGAGKCERSWYQDEQPASVQCFDEPFWIDVYEVTNAQYGSPGEWAGDELARERVNWADAVAHCESRGARLPTEAEWEYAARGPDGLVFPWGDLFKRALVNSCDWSCEFNMIGTRTDDGYPNTAPVGSYAGGASWVGAMDVSGNVWEWTSSIYMDYPYNATDGREVDGSTDSNSKRVLRGGSWYHSGSDLLRSAARYEASPDFSDYITGFRCAVPSTHRPVPPMPTATVLPPLTGRGGGVIAFFSDRDGNNEIYVMNADGSDQRNLTHNAFSDTDPAWSPDGTRIAFASTRDRNYEIYVMDADGSNVRRLTNNLAIDVDPTWSPDSSRIAFLSRRDGNVEVYMANVDDGGVHRLTFNRYDDFEIDWSPDGKLIAVASQVGQFADIYTINVEAAAEGVVGRNQLTDTKAHDGFPRWSPDGSQIAFISNREGEENWEVYIMNSDGSDQRRLTHSAGLDGIPTWSPDGTRIAFESDRDGDLEIHLVEVEDAIRDPEGAEIIRLTDNDADDHHPAWRPELPSPNQGSGRVEPITMTYGGRHNDQAFDVLVTEDGGSLIAGQANNTGPSHRITPGNAQLIRTDAEGTIIWEKEYGGEDDALFSSIIQAGEDEYVVLGEIAASYSRDETDLYLVKVDGQGNEIWSRTFGGRGMDLGKMVRLTTDGGYILVGDQADEYPTANVYESNLYLIKTDAEGNLVWSRTYGDEILYLGWGVAQTPDGGYVLTGWEAKTHDDRDVILIKTDESGGVEWSRTWDLGERDGGFDLILTSDGYVVMACIQSMGSGGPSAVLVKVDLDGNEIWNKLIGEEGVGNTFWHIVEDSDGGYVLAGDTHVGKAPRTGEDLHGAWLIKTDADGEIVWQRVVGEGEYKQAHVRSAALLPGGGYLFVGDATLNGQIYSDILWLRTAGPAGESEP